MKMKNRNKRRKSKVNDGLISFVPFPVIHSDILIPIPIYLSIINTLNCNIKCCYFLSHLFYTAIICDVCVFSESNQQLTIRW